MQQNLDIKDSSLFKEKKQNNRKIKIIFDSDSDNDQIRNADKQCREYDNTKENKSDFQENENIFKNENIKLDENKEIIKSCSQSSNSTSASQSNNSSNSKNLSLTHAGRRFPLISKCPALLGFLLANTSPLAYPSATPRTLLPYSPQP